MFKCCRGVKQEQSQWLTAAPFTSSCTSWRPDTLQTLPTACPGLIICHDPSCAAALRAGSTALSTRLTAKAGPPLTTSSANRSMYQSSAPKACPRALEIGVRRWLMASEASAMARRMRSTTAVACTPRPLQHGLGRSWKVALWHARDTGTRYRRALGVQSCLLWILHRRIDVVFWAKGA